MTEEEIKTKTTLHIIVIMLPFIASFIYAYIFAVIDKGGVAVGEKQLGSAQRHGENSAKVIVW